MKLKEKKTQSRLEAVGGLHLWWVVDCTSCFCRQVFGQSWAFRTLYFLCLVSLEPSERIADLAFDVGCAPPADDGLPTDDTQEACHHLKNPLC